MPGQTRNWSLIIEEQAPTAVFVDEQHKTAPFFRKRLVIETGLVRASKPKFACHLLRITVSAFVDERGAVLNPFRCVGTRPRLARPTAR